MDLTEIYSQYPVGVQFVYILCGKPRLVLDCRYINPELFKFNCHYEDHSVARQIFFRGDYFFTFDIGGAYHQIMIYPENCTYLGFAWYDGKCKRYYCYTVLAFGLSTAGYIFTKLMCAVIEKWRALSYRVVVLLDDGMGGETGHQKAVEASCYIRKDLINFGFLIADEQCCWEPRQGARWLGLDWNAVKGTVSIGLERMNRALSRAARFVDNTFSVWQDIDFSSTSCSHGR